MEQNNIAEETIKHYIEIEKNWYFEQYPENVEKLLSMSSSLQRFVDDNDFILRNYVYNNGRYWIEFDYNNSHTHAALVIINYKEITINHTNYYGNFFIKIDENGILGNFGSVENTCFIFDDKKINDYTLKYDYEFQSEDVPGKISELISYAKNYYPKAFKAKCAKQREREISEKLKNMYSN